MTQKTLDDLKLEADRLSILANKDPNSDTSVLAEALEVICKALIEIGQSPQSKYPQSGVFRNPPGR